MHLPDINVWLALTFDSHVHHPSAKTSFDGLPNNAICVFCRHTQMGFLRPATNPKVFGKHSLTLPGAWHEFDVLMSDARVSYAEEPIDLEVHWRAFTQARIFAPQLWSDAYLAAFALAGNQEIVTFDKGFSQFTGVKCLILS